MEYSYITDDNLENVQSYMYTPYGGEEFLKAYFRSRSPWTAGGKETAEAAVRAMTAVPCAERDAVSEELMGLLSEEDWTAPGCKETADKYVKRFEVRKRLYGVYDPVSRRPDLASGYQEPDRYLLLSAVAERAYRQWGSLKYLNCLVKVNDTVLSLMGTLSERQRALAGELAACEVEHVKALAQQKGLRLGEAPTEENGRLDDIACVLADTTRSQAYIQALARSGLLPAKCLILERSAADMRPAPPEPGPGSRQYFDAGETLLDTLEKYGIDYGFLGTRDINSPELDQVFRGLPQQYLIYSGYGGVILQPHLFRTGRKWIHVHAGILPAYRGSTTAYYSILDSGRMGATAIFLNEKIDEGDIICEREFLPPEDGTLIDYYYEPYIRSCVLAEALGRYRRNGTFTIKRQKMEAGGGGSGDLLHHSPGAEAYRDIGAA